MTGTAAFAQNKAASTDQTPAAAVNSAQPDSSATVYRGGPERTGFAQQEASPPLSVAWQNTVTPLAGNQSTPTLDNGVIFFGTASSVYAVNAADGSLKWRYPSADSLTNPDVAHPGLFDCPATVADGKVYIGNDDHNLYVIDEASGTLAWQVQTGGYIRSAPVVSDGVVYFGSGDSKFYAVRTDNQKPAWGGAFRTTGQVTAPAAVSASDVFFIDGGDTLYCAALSSGRLTWSNRFDSNISDSSPILANGVVIVGAGRDLYGISPAAGATRWHLTLPANLTAQIALSGDGTTIYAATSDNSIVALNLRGQVQWSAPLGSPVSIAPVATTNTVVAITHSGIVRVLDAGTGQTRWAYTLASIGGPRLRSGSTISAVPLVTAGSLYTLSDSGTLTAFRTNASDNLPPTPVLVTPQQTRAVAGAQIAYTIFVNDIGTGVNPATVALKVDGSTTVPVTYDVNTGYIQVRTVARDIGAPAPVSLPTLTSGVHSLTLTVADWRGNQLSKTWNFTVNDALNPAGSALPATETSSSTPSNDAPPAQSSAAGGNAGGADTNANSGAGGAAGGSIDSGGSSGAGSNTSGARPTGSGGAGPTPGPGTGAGPQPSTPPSGGGAGPVSPPGAGGSGFPPPPPI